MSDTGTIQGLSANLKKAVCWISDNVRENPGRSRAEIITEAELRFDLTPRECEFLDNRFTDLTGKNCSAQD